MKPTFRLRREAGFTYVEVMASLAVLCVGVMGFAGTVVYTGNLNRTTTKLWHENVAATGALEDVRDDAADQWQSINSTWDGHEVVADGASSQTETLTTTVNDDPSKLNSSDGMWSDGAVAPNFYHVSVTGSGSGANGTVNYQTYVADRSGFASLQAAAYVGSSAGNNSGSSGTGTTGGITTGTMAQRFDLTPRNVVVSGSTMNKVAFQLMNGSATTSTLKSISIRINNDRYSKAVVGGTTVYDNPFWPIGARAIHLGDGGKSVAPGLVDFAVTGINGINLAGHTMTVKMKFKDGSYATATVRP
jgi:Tfp pilus assembly protein PilV